MKERNKDSIDIFAKENFFIYHQAFIFLLILFCCDLHILLILIFEKVCILCKI